VLPLASTPQRTVKSRPRTVPAGESTDHAEPCLAVHPPVAAFPRCQPARRYAVNQKRRCGGSYSRGPRGERPTDRGASSRDGNAPQGGHHECVLTDTLARLGFTAEPSRYHGLHSVYDADGTLIGTFDSYGCWQ
jgi:hypothetical protein